MEKILSQDEIDALLKGVVSGEVDTAPKEAAEEATSIKGYDLFNQERIVARAWPAAENRIAVAELTY